MSEQTELAPHIQEIARALENRVEMEQIEDELSRYLEYGVPLAQAKRDIVRNHGGTLRGGAKLVKDLAPGESGVDLHVKILTKNAKEITARGEQKTIWYGFLADESAKVSYTLWKDHGIEAGKVYKIGDVLAKPAYRGDGVEINIGDYAKVEASDEEINVQEAPLPNAGRASGPMKVKALAEGVSSATVTARVVDAREKTINTANGEKTLLEGELADETGKVLFTSWEPDLHREALTKDNVVKIQNGYVKAFRGVPNLNFGENAKVETLAADALPDLATLDRSTRFTIGELERVGGGTDVAVEGVVLEVKKGSGLIQRCPECNRVLQKRECRLHGRVEGVADLRVKAVLDDGTGAVTFFLNREGTEKILGKTLEECQSVAKEAMTMDVVADELADALTAKSLAVTGNATSDDFGLQIIARTAAFAPPVDAKAEAEKLLAEVRDLIPAEVS